MEILFKNVERENSYYYTNTYCVRSENNDEYQRMFDWLKDNLDKKESEVLDKELSKKQSFTLYVEKKGVKERIPVIGFVYKERTMHLGSTRIYLDKTSVRKLQLRRLTDCYINEYELDWL